MKNIPLVDEKQYFLESEKVIQIVKEREDEVRRRLPAEYRLRMAKEFIKNVKTREDFEELNDEIKNLEFEIKYDKDHIPAIPEEYQNKIAFNRVHEEEQIDQEIEKQKKLLLSLVNDLEKPLINVLKNIERLEERKLLGKKIDILLDEVIVKDGRIHSTFAHANRLGFSGEHSNSKDAREKGEELFHALNKIATAPKQENGIKKPSIFDRMLGEVK